MKTWSRRWLSFRSRILQQELVLYLLRTERSQLEGILSSSENEIVPSSSTSDSEYNYSWYNLKEKLLNVHVDVLKACAARDPRISRACLYIYIRALLHKLSQHIIINVFYGQELVSLSSARCLWYAARLSALILSVSARFFSSIFANHFSVAAIASGELGSCHRT